MSESLPRCTVGHAATIGELRSLEQEWLQLWEESPEATAFQHPSWIFSWWKQFGDGKQIQSFFLRNNGTLVAIAPLCILTEAGQRKVMFLGAGLSDSADVLFSPGYGPLVATALFRFLQENAFLWDVCDLQPIPRDSPLLNSASFSTAHAVAAPEAHTILELPSDSTALRERLSAHFKERIRDASRRAAKLGEVRFEQARNGLFESVFDALLRFRRARWKDSEDQETRHTKAELFFRESARAIMERRELRLFSMSVSGRIAAVLHGFVHRSRASLYLMGFAEEFAKVSPGVLLIYHALEVFINEGIVECNFLRGREPFKYRWGVIERPHYALRLAHPGAPE